MIRKLFFLSLFLGLVFSLYIGKNLFGLCAVNSRISIDRVADTTIDYLIRHQEFARIELVDREQRDPGKRPTKISYDDILRRYLNNSDFKAKNTDCCRIEKINFRGDAQSMRLVLLGGAAYRVTVAYDVVVRDEFELEKEFEHERNFIVQQCGSVREINPWPRKRNTKQFEVDLN